jgi:hypothetical protein
MHRRALLLIAAAGVFLAGNAAAREGFGFTKKAVTMTRTVPPATNLGARRVKISATSERGDDKDDANALRRYIEEAVLSGAGTISPSEKGDLTLKVTIDRVESHESWETRQKSEYRKVGSHQEWDEKKKKYVSKDDYDTVYTTVNVKVVTGSVSGAFDVLDKSGKVADSGSISESFSRKYDEGQGALTPGDVEDQLLKRAAALVAARIVPTQDRVSVIVPKGSFEPFIPLAESNAWDRYLAAVEAVPSSRKSREEAYRQYALAVAKEGLAYATREPARALDLLREAVTHYDNAMRGHPGEKIFVEAYESFWSGRAADAPLARANASLAAYEGWTPTGAAKPRATTMVASSAKEAGPAEVMTNQTLIEMSKAGLAEENLILSIDAAAATEFDTTPAALIALSKAGVSKNVIAKMQKKASGGKR